MIVLHVGSAGSASMGIPLPPRKPSVSSVALMVPSRAPDTAPLNVSLTDIPHAHTQAVYRTKEAQSEKQAAPAAGQTIRQTISSRLLSAIGFAYNAGRAVFQSPAGNAIENEARLDAVFSDSEAVNRGRPLYQRVWKDIRALTSRTRPTAALKALGNHPEAKNLTAVEYDQIRSHIAQAYMTAGKLNDARKLAQASFDRSGHAVPLAGWVSGLVAWRQGRFDEASDYFAKSAQSARQAKHSSPWMASASSLWAARSYIKAGDDRNGEKWLHEAARYNQTFYGMIALRALDRSIDIDASDIRANPMLFVRFLRNEQAQEAVKLAREGKPGQAIAQLGKLGWLSGTEEREVVMHYALKKNIPTLALHLAKRYPRNAEGNLYQSALYPVIPWKPSQGYTVDKALVHALVRQESDFNPFARNATGASGLMQLMPATASYMVKTAGIDRKKDLTDPKENLALGQAYIKHLLDDPSVNNDLFAMAIAYNAGPGNLARWKDELDDIDDPLLFIESIPVPETRAFVERVMRNYWMYCMRMGLDTPSLDAVAAGNAPTYIHQEYAALN